MSFFLLRLMKHPGTVLSTDDEVVTVDLSKVTDGELVYIAPEVLNDQLWSQKADIW